jgi:Tfp pilus assembly protein PilN
MKHPALQLEFAPQARRIPPVSMGLLLVSMLALGLCLLALAKGLTEQAQQSRQLAALGEARRNSSTLDTPVQRRDPLEVARAQFVRKTARSMATPWADLLAALESTPADVALLSVEPSATKRRVTLTAEVASDSQMLAYLRSLQADSRLSNVLLVSHQLQAQAPGTPLRFQLEARWGDGS